MPGRHVLPIIMILLGLWGMFRFAKIINGDRDPALYYLTAGLCLGRDSWYQIEPPSLTDPLYRRAQATGGKLMLSDTPLMPYRDFTCEYPPAALLTFLFPRLFTDDVLTYYWLFAAEMAIPAIGLGWLAFRILQFVQPSGNALQAACLSWTPWIFASGHVLLHRFDLVAVFCVALGVLCILRRHWGLAGVWLGIGASIKVYPIFLLLPCAIVAFGDKRWWTALQLLLGAVVAPVASHLAVMPWTGMAVFNYWSYHGARGIEVESMWTPFILFFSNPGGALHCVRRFGCDQLESTSNLNPWIVGSYVSMLLTNLACVCIACLIARIPLDSQRWRIRVLALCLATITFSIVTAKVLSIQYVFWLFPVAMVIPRRTGAIIAGFYLLALELGTLWFPHYWPAIIGLTTAGKAVMLLRNLLLVAIAVCAAVFAIKYRPREGDLDQNG